MLRFGTTTKTRRMTPCRPADVVLVRFPFTDFTVSKKRPALVVCPDGYEERYNDVVLLPLTSTAQPELELVCWREAGLIKRTWIKPLLATVSSIFVLKRLGSLAEADNERVVRALRALVDRRFLPVAEPA